MEMLNYFESNKVLGSMEAVRGAARLKGKLDSGQLKMDILPNTYEQFSGRLEAEDYVSYCQFLKSRNGRIVLDMLEDEDEETYVE